MKRKVLCSILAILIVLASVPMTAFAADGEKTITDISLTATRDLIQYYDGWYNEEEVTPYFYYDVFNAAKPDMVVTYSDGTSENVSYDNFHEHFWNTDIVTVQSVATEFGVGTNTAEIVIYYGDYGEKSITTEIEFTIAENPIESVSAVATKPLIENVDGCWEELIYADENGNEVVVAKTFFYDVAETEPTVTVKYKNGDTKTFPYGTMLDETGYDIDLVNYNSHENPYKLGEDNVAEVSVLGVKAEFTFAIISDPVEKITVVPTKTIQFEKDGWWTDCYEAEGQYFDYDISATEPQITVEYNDGTPAKTCAWGECYDIFGEEPSYECDQQNNPFSIGENSVTVKFLGHETTYTFEIIPNPIKSVSLDVRYKLEENKSGYMGTEYDDDDNCIGEYFYYDLDWDKTFVTVEYNDETKEPLTFCLNDLGEYFDEGIDIDLGQSYENQLAVGVHTGTVKFNGVTGTFTFEIIPNPVEKITVVPTKTIQFEKDGWWTDCYEAEGQYFNYDISATEPQITVEYNDGTSARTCAWGECYDIFGEEPSYECDQQNNPFSMGENSVTVKFLGHETTYTFEIVPNPVKSISAKATKDLVENQNGALNGEGLGGVYFHYHIFDTEPEVTVTYTDGKVKTYTYQEINNLDEDFSVYTQQSGDKPLKPGTHTGIVEFAGRKCEFTFKILEDPIKNVVITPTRDLVQYADGYNVESSDGNWFFWYDLEDTRPTVTINYKDGTSKTYTLEEIRRYTDSDLDIIDNQDSDSQLKVGTNKTTVYFNNNEYEYTFNLKKAEKTVTSISVVPEGKLVENIGGYMDSEDDKDFYVYYNYAITYTVTIKYSDGTTKTQKGVRPYQEIDGSDFDIYFECHSYDNRFTVGKNNTGVAYYKNATCTFPVEVVENDYKSIEISGDNSFVFSFVKQDGSKVSYTAQSFNMLGRGENELGVLLRTDKGNFNVIINYKLNDDGTSLQNISVTLDDENSTLKSNTLASNKWLDIMICAGDIANIAATYSDGYSKHFYNRDFKGINGTIKGSLVDDALTLCTSDEYYRDYENYGEDEKGRFAILSLEEAKELLKDYFDPAKVDITTSPMYNAPAKEIKIYFLSYLDGSLSNEKLEYKNGKFVLTGDWSSQYRDKTTPVTIVFANTGYVESISFTKGDCGTIKTINAANANGGVKVTYSASENAIEYEIYRSTNGGKYEKVGTSEKLSFVDTTVVSGKTYTYKVRGINPTNTGSFSGTKTVSYLAMPKTTATITKTGYTVKWTKVDGAATYRIYRAEYANGKWSNWNKLTDQKASATSFADKTVKAGGVYKYTVRAMASGGVASAYEGTPTLVYLTTPTVKIVNAKGGVKGSWNAVSGAEGYIIYRSEYNTTTKKWSGWTNLGTTKATAKSFTDKTAVSGKMYRYTVRAVNGDNKSLYTASNSLLYLAEPTVTIANAKTGITVKWTKSGGAKGYTVYRSEYNASTKKWSSWKNMGTTAASKTSWTDKSAKAGVTYKYTVRAVNEKVKSTFTASASLVRLAQPTVNIANAKTGITVKWSKVTGATGYRVYRQELVNGKWGNWVNRGTAKATKTSWTDTKIVSGATYRYTVRAVNGKSMSSYTATASLMFLSEPTVKIANAATGVKVSWSKVDGATGYIVYRSQYNTKTKKWSGWSNRGTAKADKTSWTDKKVTSGVQYKYTVRAINGNFKSTYTSSGKLIYLAQPVVTSAKTTSGVAVKWTKSAGATSYIVYRQEMTEGAWSNWKALTTTKSAVNSYSDKTVEAGKEYRYTVRAVNGKFKSAFKASNSVKR